MAAPNPSNLITGGRTVVSIFDSNTNQTQIVGIFDSCSTSESLGVEDVHTLGAFGPREIAVTSSNSVKVTCSGFRVYGFGVKKIGSYPTLNALLGLGPVTLTIFDRQQPAGSPPLATVVGCVADSNNNSYNARATSKVNITYTGTVLTDEAGSDGKGGADGESGSSPAWP